MSVTVQKFKLEGRGYQGVKVSGQETRDKEGLLVIVDIEMNFKIPLPTEIFGTVQRLKRYMLDLCGYWHPSFDAFIKQGKLVDMPIDGPERSMYQHLMQLMDAAEVSGVVSKDANFIITGKLVNVIGGTVGLSTPLTGPNSGYDRWDFLSRGCRQCIEQVQAFVNERRLRMMPPKQYALWDEKDPEKIDQYENMSEDDLLKVQIKNLENKGAIVLMPDDFGKEEDTGPKIEERVMAEHPAEELGTSMNLTDEQAAEIMVEHGILPEDEEIPPEEIPAADDLPENKD